MFGAAIYFSSGGFDPFSIGFLNRWGLISCACTGLEQL
jgi:hypothetical protein